MMLLRFLFALTLLSLPMSQAYGGDDDGFDFYIAYEGLRPFNSTTQNTLPVLQFDCSDAMAAGSGACSPTQGAWTTETDIKARGLSQAVQVGVKLPFYLRLEAEVLLLDRSSGTGSFSLPTTIQNIAPDSGQAIDTQFDLRMDQIESENLLFNMYYDFKPKFSNNNFIQKINFYVGGGVGATTTRVLRPSLGVQVGQSSSRTALPAVQDGQHIYQFVAGVDLPMLPGLTLGVKGRFLDDFGPGFIGYYNESGQQSPRVINSTQLNQMGVVGVQLRINFVSLMRAMSN